MKSAGRITMFIVIVMITVFQLSMLCLNSMGMGKTDPWFMALSILGIVFGTIGLIQMFRNKNYQGWTFAAVVVAVLTLCRSIGMFGGVIY